MKQAFTILFALLNFGSVLSAQQFQTTIRSTGNTVDIFIKPDATGSVSFSVIEFFIRYPSTETLNFSDFQAGTTSFPGIVFADNNLTPLLRQPGFNSIYIAFLPPAVPTTAVTYTMGQEYKVCSFKVNGSTATTNLQIIHEANDFDPYYVTLTKRVMGSDIDAAPALGSDYFYPNTNNTVLGADNFYYYQLSNVVLPISMVDFTAMVENTNALLSWKTGEERNVTHFDVEKSLDGKSFVKIDEVKANNTPSVYKVFDNQFSFSAYYRLKTKELDGTGSYSKIIFLEKNSNKSIKISHNTGGAIWIETNDKIELITVTNTIGQVVKITKDKQFLINDLRTGIYIISVKTDSGFLSQKVFNQ